MVENLFLALFGLFGAIAYAVTYEMQLIGTPGKIFRILAWAFSIGFLVLRLTSKTTYIFDAKRKVLMCNFSLLSFNFNDVAARFGQISATGVDYKVGRHRPTNTEEVRYSHYYKLVILLKTGKVLSLSGFERDADQKHDYSAKKIAELVNCNYCEAEPGCWVSPVKLASGQYTFEKHMEERQVSNKVAFLVIAGFIALLAMAAYNDLK
jgi:hypothetical protein